MKICNQITGKRRRIFNKEENVTMREVGKNGKFFISLCRFTTSCVCVDVWMGSQGPLSSTNLSHQYRRLLDLPLTLPLVPSSWS